MKTLPILMSGLLAVSAAAARELPRLIAHRGASQQAPENTLAAIRLAWQEGADGIEGDFYLTKDREVVCIHDKDTERTAGVKRAVTASTLAELRQLDVGKWKGAQFAGERIPTLAEVLDALPAGKWFFLEIKDSPRIVPVLAEILAARQADPARVVLISFDAAVVKACREQAPAYRALWISDLKDFAKTGGGDPLAKLRAAGSGGLAFKATAPVTAEWLKTARGNEGLLLAWTVNDSATATRMAELGVDFLGTDRPGGLRRELTAQPSFQ